MSLWDNKDAESWDKNVPSELIPAIKYLRESFDWAHSTFGLFVTMPLCYSQLHNGAEITGFGETKEYIKSLVQLKGRIGPATTRRFHELLTQGTLPAIFKGFFDFYLEGLKVQSLLIFNELLGIGRANEVRLNCPHVEWAESQTRHLIRDHRHNIKMWVRDVCDEHVYEPKAYDPNDDPLESYWNTWRAPAFLIMKPSRYGLYEAAKVWERNDSETSLQWLEMFADHYVLILESAVEDAAADAALELAKHPKQVQHGTVDSYVEPFRDQEIQTTNKPPLDRDADRRSKLRHRVENDKAGTLRTDEVAILFAVSRKTVSRWVEIRKLTGGARRGTVTNESIRRILPKPEAGPFKSV